MTPEKLLAALSADVLEALAEDGSPGLPGPEVLQHALDVAGREVRDALPLAVYQSISELPGSLDDHVVILAIEALFLRRREMVPGPWADRAARTRKILAEMAAGRHPLPGRQPTRRVEGTTTPPPRRNPALKKW